MGDLPSLTVRDVAAAVPGCEILVDSGVDREIDRAGCDPATAGPGRLLVCAADNVPDLRAVQAVALMVAGEVDDETLDAARRAGLALLQVKGTSTEAMSAVGDVLLDRQVDAAARAQWVHRALAAVVRAGGDLTQIATELGRVLDALVVLCTPDGRVLGASGDSASVAAAGLLDDAGRLRVGRVGGGLERVADGEAAVVPVIAAGVDHARIVAFRSGRLPTGAVAALGSAATVAALALTKRVAVSAVEGKFRGDFLHDVLAGEAGDAATVVESCAALGWDVGRPVVVVVAELDTGPDGSARAQQDRFVSSWAQAVAGLDRATPIVGFRRRVVVLLPAEADAKAAVERVLNSVGADLDRGSFSTGVSRTVADPTGLPAAYEQARRAVAVGRQVRGPGSVAHFDSLGVHRLLSLVADAGELKAFAAEVLGELARDTADAADLRTTLQTLLDTNLNVAETARALHFHYNTLRYRIGKLERIVGPFTTDPHLRLDVALALQVVQMRGV